MNLAESLRANKFKNEYSSPGKKEKENIMKKLNASRSRSPKGFMGDANDRETMKLN